MKAQPIRFVETAPMATPAGTVEGIARVVGIAADTLWLEPEQTTSCGSCASAASCGHGDPSHDQAPGIGSIASRLKARRFTIARPAGLFGLGDRLVVGVGERALLKAALAAYGLPLVSALLAGCAAQALYGKDGLTMIGMAYGLGFGLLLARFAARQLAIKGELAPRFLRRASPNDICGTG